MGTTGMKAKIEAGRATAFQRWYVITELYLIGLIAEHRDLERLCMALEECANGLPELPADTIEALCAALDTNARQACRGERFSALFEDLPASRLAENILDHIRVTHGTCTVQAQDLIAALGQYRRTEQSVAADTLGYMMRSFFDNCRHLIAFEQLAVLQFTGDRLTRDAKCLLNDNIAAVCRH